MQLMGSISALNGFFTFYPRTVRFTILWDTQDALGKGFIVTTPRTTFVCTFRHYLLFYVGI